jgi:hypothetical protein
MNAGRHREVQPTVADLVSMPANAGTKIAAIGVLGSTAALSVPGMAAAATTGGPGPGVTAPAGSTVSAPLSGFTWGGQSSAIPSAKPTVSIFVIGDSFTSGEGANASTYTTTPTQISPLTGDVFPPLIYPQHQSTTSPVMQAIGALQAANPNVNFVVTNVSVSGATRVTAGQPSQEGTYFEQPAQLTALQAGAALGKADIVYNGLAGGNDNNFADWAKNALVAPDSFMPTVWNSLYLPKFTSGQNLTDQQNFLNNLAQLAPGATIITPSYPEPFQGQTSQSWSLGSPFVSSFGQNAANLSDLFAQWLNADSASATGSANVANMGTGNTFLDVNMLNSLNGHSLTSAEPGMNGVVPFSWGQGSMGQASLHPDPLGQTQMASAIYPVLAAAANRILGQQGIPLNTDLPSSLPMTPAYTQNAAGVQAQLSLITKFQQASDMTTLANQAQNGQTTNPDGSLTNWGQLLAGINLNGQQPPAAWPGTPTSGSQDGNGSLPGTPQQGTPQQGQPMPDITGGFLPPELGGTPQYPPAGAWGGPQGGGPQGGAPQWPQGGAPQGQPAAPATGDTNPAPGGTNAAPGGTNAAPGGTGTAPAGGDTTTAPGSTNAAPPGGDTSTAPAGGTAAPAPASGAPAPATPAAPAPAAPASQPAATPSSFTSTPDPTNPNPAPAPGPVTSNTSNPAPTPVAVNPAPISVPTTAPIITPTITPPPPPISTPTIATASATSNLGSGSLGGSSFGSLPSVTAGDPAPVVMAGGSGGAVGSG